MADIWSRIQQGPRLQWGDMLKAAPDPRVALSGGGVTTNTAGLNSPSVALSGGATTNTAGLNSGFGNYNAPFGGGARTLPVAYNAAQDTSRWELNGKYEEKTMDRAMRQAADMVRDRKATDFQHALTYILANQSSDFRRGDRAAASGTLGYDPGQFVDNAYGEAYDPNKVYLKGGQGAQGGGTGQYPQASGPWVQRDGPMEWTYQKQAQEGSDVVMPNLDPTGGGGQGGTMPGQQPGGTGNPLFNEGLAGEKSLRLAYLLEQLGLNTPMSRRNMYTSSVADRVGSVMDPWLQTQGLAGGDPGAHQQDLLGKLAGYFQGGGGGMGAVAGDARTATQQVMNDPRYTGDKGGLRDQELLALLSGFNQLSSLPQNDWLQRAFGNMREDLAGDYARFNANPATFGTSDILGFIRNNPIYGFMTGQQR